MGDPEDLTIFERNQQIPLRNIGYKASQGKGEWKGLAGAEGGGRGEANSRCVFRKEIKAGGGGACL